MRVETITSFDGSPIAIYSTGAGPGLVVLHGGGVAEREYRRLAAALAERLTVHLYNRRGRPDTAPLTGTETVETDLGDLAAVLRHTGAEAIFGHSGGGFVAMRAGLGLPGDVPVRRIGVFDPALRISGRPSADFLPEFEKAVADRDHVRALTVMSRGVYPDDLAARLPFGLAEQVTKAFLLTPVGRRMSLLLPTSPPEVRRIYAQDGPASDYAGVEAEVLLAAGSRSPRYFTQNCEAVAAALPRGRALVLKGSHNAANIARPAFVRPFADFFAGERAAAAS